MKHCTTNKCPQILDSSCVFYEGPTLLFSGINTNDSLETVIQKLNLKLESIPGINLDNYFNKQEINNFLSGKQNTIGYTPENVSNKSDSYTASSSVTYASTKALVDGLDTKLDKGNYTGTAQDLKNEIDGKANTSHTHDISSITNLQTALDGKEDISNKQNNLNADATNTKYPTVTAVNDGLATKQKQLSSFDESILIESDGNIEGNVSLFTEYFNQQVCELNFIPTQIIGVYQDGIKLLNSEYEIILPKKIKIKEYVDENIQIEYTHLKS